MEMVESKHLSKLEIGHMNLFLENHQYSRLQMALLYSLIPQKVTDRVYYKYQWELRRIFFYYGQTWNYKKRHLQMWKKFPFGKPRPFKFLWSFQHTVQTRCNKFFDLEHFFQTIKSQRYFWLVCCLVWLKKSVES